MGKKEVKLKTVMSREQLAGYLEGLASSVRQGHIPIETEEDKVLLKTAANAGVKIEAAEKKDKYKLELKMSWPQAVIQRQALFSVLHQTAIDNCVSALLNNCAVKAQREDRQ